MHRIRSLMWPVTLGVVITMLVAGGWWIGERQAGHRDAEMRDGLLRDAIHMAGTINSGLARQLTFTAADRDNPAYRRIREQMCADAAEISHGGIYSMSLRDGKIFFGPETYRAGDPLASAPGSQYLYPSQECFAVFTSRTPVVFGPQEDEYGTFVTALAPVMDETGNVVIMVVGIDIQANDWANSLSSVHTRPLILTGLLAFFVLFASIFASWHVRRINPIGLKVRLWVMTPSVLAILVAAVLYGMYEYKDREHTSHLRMHVLHDKAQEKWSNVLLTQVQALKMTADRLTDNADLAKVWEEKDPHGVAPAIRRLCDSLRVERGISQLTCIDSDRTVLTRGHIPGVYGDIINTIGRVALGSERRRLLGDGTGVPGVDGPQVRSSLALRWTYYWLPGDRQGPRSSCFALHCVDAP